MPKASRDPDHGIYWYVGIPHSGKTTLARAHAARISRERSDPVCVVDSAEVAQLQSIPPLTYRREIIACLYDAPRANCRVVPQDPRELDDVCSLVRTGKNVVLLVDESNVWTNANGKNVPNLLRIMRSTQHCRINALFTTQHLTGDVSQAALTCATKLFVFRCISPRVLDVLEREFGCDRRTVSTLPQFSYLTIEVGF